MADRPIIFSAPMVLALLAGRKSQTRRVLKPQPGELDVPQMWDDGSWHVTASDGTHLSPLDVRWRIGDRLWVREAVCGNENPWGGQQAVRYIANNDLNERLASHPGFWRLRNYQGGDYLTVPSIHMPRWASRLTLTVTEVRVERLQDISEEDAEAEGIDDLWLVQNRVPPPRRSSYRHLWNDLHGPDAWAANPWVAAIIFATERRNIDTPIATLPASLTERCA